MGISVSIQVLSNKKTEVTVNNITTISNVRIDKGQKITAKEFMTNLSLVQTDPQHFARNVIPSIARVGDIILANNNTAYRHQRQETVLLDLNVNQFQMLTSRMAGRLNLNQQDDHLYAMIENYLSRV